MVPVSDNKGININDKVQDYTGQILRGEKTIETRPSRSLDSRIGKRTGIIRTGAGKATLVGYAIIGKPVVYDSVAKFRRDQSKHRVAPGSIHDIKGGLKYGYPLMQVEAVTPRVITSRGNVIRKLNPLSYSPEQITYAALTPTSANVDIAAGKALWETPAFKKWFGDSKVRDLAKRPAVFYHGTCSSGFTKFDPTKTREMGFHFGTPPQAKDFLKACSGSISKSPGIYPVYLSIQNPLFTPDVYSSDPVYFIEWLEKTNHIHEWFPDEDDSYYRSLNKLRSQLAEARMLSGPEVRETNKRLQKTVWGLLRKIVMRKGYDGIRYKNENEGRTDDPSNMAWIAFSPAQVKSATDNRGTFNRRDPDLRNPMKEKPFWEMTEKEYIQATGMPKQVLPYSPGYAEYEKWKRNNLNYFEMVEKAARAGKRIPDAIVASLPAGIRSRVKADLPKTEKQFNREYVIHGSKTCLDFIEPRIGDFTREAYSGSGEGTFEEMGGKEYAYFRNPEDIDLVLQYAGNSGCVMVSQMPGDALFVKQDGLYNEYDELVSQDVGTGPEDGDIISEQGAGVLFQIPVEQWKRSGEKSIYSYLKKKMRGAIINPAKRDTVRNKLSRIIEPGDRILDYDRAQGEDLYRLWDMVHTDMALTPEALVEIEGMLDDDGVLVIQSGEEPAGLRNHFRRVTRYNGMLLVQGPMNPEEARINTEKLRRDLE